MTKIIKNNLIILTGLSFSILGFLLLPSFSLAADNICQNPCQGIADCYFVEFIGSIQMKDNRGGHQTSMEKTISLPYSGIYEVSTCYKENSGLAQLFEEYDVFVKGRNLGHTNDTNVIGYRKENLGKYRFPSGDHQVKVEHHWWYYQVSPQFGSQSIFPKNVTLVFIDSPTVDIKANNSDGPINIFYNTSADLSWTSSGASSCQASGNWSGAKPTSGSESTGNLVSVKAYNIYCSGPGGTASDSVIVNIAQNRPPVANAGPDKEIFENQAVTLEGSGSDPDGDNISYSWSCSSGSLSNSNIAQPIFYGPSVSQNTTYTCTLRVRDSFNNEASDSANILVKNQESSTLPTVDLKVNGLDSSITILYNTPATLSWNSANTDYCYASNDWTGSKSKSGSETTGNLISSKTYTLICSGPGGSVTDSAMVNVTSQPLPGNLTIIKLVRNLSDGTAWADSVFADPGEILSFRIQVRNSGSSLGQNVIIRDVLPEKISFSGDLRIDGILTGGDIISGLNIGDLSPNQSKTITFNTYVARADQFTFGDTQLENRAFATILNTSVSDTAIVIVRKAGVLGATTISTGLTNNLLLDSFILPLTISLIIVFLFRSRIIKWEEWLEKRKIEYKNYKAKKLLEIKIAKIKAGEFFKKIF